MQNKTTLLTIRETATQLNLPYRQLLNAVNAGTIPFYKIGTSRRLLSTFDVLEATKHIEGNKNA